MFLWLLGALDTLDHLENKLSGLCDWPLHLYSKKEKKYKYNTNIQLPPQVSK